MLNQPLCFRINLEPSYILLLDRRDEQMNEEFAAYSLVLRENKK